MPFAFSQYFAFTKSNVQYYTMSHVCKRPLFEPEALNGTNSSSEPKKRRYCPHCKVDVSKTTYYKHQDLYYNQSTHLWYEEGESSCGHGADVEELFTPTPRACDVTMQQEDTSATTNCYFSPDHSDDSQSDYENVRQ